MMIERGFYIFSELLEQLQVTPPGPEDARLAELWQRLWPTAATLAAHFLADRGASPAASVLPSAEWDDVASLLPEIEATPAKTAAGTMVRAAGFALSATGAGH